MAKMVLGLQAGALGLADMTQQDSGDRDPAHRWFTPFGLWLAIYVHHLGRMHKKQSLLYASLVCNSCSDSSTASKGEAQA